MNLSLLTEIAKRSGHHKLVHFLRSGDSRFKKEMDNFLAGLEASPIILDTLKEFGPEILRLKKNYDKAVFDLEALTGESDFIEAKALPVKNYKYYSDFLKSVYHGPPSDYSKMTLNADPTWRNSGGIALQIFKRKTGKFSVSTFLRNSKDYTKEKWREKQEERFPGATLVSTTEEERLK